MITRRNFFKVCLAGASLFSFKKVYASASTEISPSSCESGKTGEGGFSGDKILSMYNIHTDEHLSIQYCSSGKYDLGALEKINYFLRCHYTNQVREIDVGLLDLLFAINDAAGNRGEVRIISGYRSVDYNARLIRQGRNLSRNSLHLQGLAIDFAIEGISSERLSRLARFFAAGGVGKYPEFVHIDVGRVRYW